MGPVPFTIYPNISLRIVVSMIGILRSALPSFPGGIALSGLSISGAFAVLSTDRPGFRAGGSPGPNESPPVPQTFQVIPPLSALAAYGVHPTGAKGPEKGETAKRALHMLIFPGSMVV